MSDDIWQLKQRITKLSDEELIEMVTANAADYRQEPLDYAMEELKYRHVDLTKLQAEEEPAIDDSEPAADTDPYPLVAAPSGRCACGGTLRRGTLVAEKELTIIFSDSHEERFVRVLACSRCNQVSMVVDPDTVVEG